MSESSNDGSVKTPVYKKWWFWAIIAVVVIGAIAGGVLGGGTGETDDSDDAPTQYAKGETATLDGLEYTISATEINSILYTPDLVYSPTHTEAGAEWVCVGIKVKNTKSYSKSVGDSNFSLIVGDKKYDVDTDVYTYWNEGEGENSIPGNEKICYMNSSTSIDPSFAKDLIIMFKVPKGLKLENMYISIEWLSTEIQLLLA